MAITIFQQKCTIKDYSKAILCSSFLDEITCLKALKFAICISNNCSLCYATYTLAINEPNVALVFKSYSLKFYFKQFQAINKSIFLFFHRIAY